MFEEVFTGGRRTAMTGVVLLLLGLGVSATGNILSTHDHDRPAATSPASTLTKP
jgi:hypothetical protein